MQIPVKNGSCIVDKDDFDYLSQYKWYLNHDGYAAAGINGKVFLMHRLINDTPKGLLTDHINGDKLDNRKSNLRSCTNAENQRNQKKIRGKSKYKGVAVRKSGYEANIYLNKKRIYIGIFPSEEEAAIAYNRKAVEIFGEFASLNNVC